MKYSERLVTQEILKNDVLCYWRMSAEIDKTVGLHSRYLPKGQNLLVFNFGDSIEYLDASNIMFLSPKFVVVPAIATSRMINQKGKIDLFGISFIGDGLFKLLAQPIAKVVNNFPDELKKKFEEMHAALAKLSFSERISYAETFLTDNLDQNLNSPAFQQAITIIHHEMGKAAIGDIANKVCVTNRHLQRLFKSRIGISPKDYCKIVRVNHYLEFILSKGKPVDWMELVTEYNYHDQPHLINEIKSIARLSPQKLQNYKDTLYHRYTQS